MKKRFLVLSIVVLALVVSATGAQGPGYNEAPMLAERVAAGELPPVEDRLPTEPLVVEGPSIGEYGGTFNRGSTGAADISNYIRVLGYENLVRWTPDWSGVIPNIAKSWEASDDARVYTFHLREDMKWSDGVPFTSADIMFWYEDVIKNEDLTPSPPAFLLSAGELVEVTAPDEYTVVFSFAEPNGLFLRNMASHLGVAVAAYPRHYLEQFHIAYNEEEVLNLVEEQGFEDWTGVFTDFGGGNPWSINRFKPEMPVLLAWMPTNEFTPDTTVMRFERNPYYWKVDAEGNQYPYFDEITFTIFADTETMLISAAAGEIDMQSRFIGTVANRPLLADTAEDGGFEFFEMVPDANNTINLNLNLNHSDPVLREVFQNKDFRIALSHAINRQEIIDLLYLGLAEPHQAAPLPESPYYHERLATQYLEYDVDLANEMLDEAGFAERDGDGFRLGPDGNRITFAILSADDVTAEINDALVLISRYWEEVGIEALPRVVNRNAFEDLVWSSQHDAAIWIGTGGIDIFGDPRYYFPFSRESYFANRWAAWYQNDTRTVGGVVAESETEAALAAADDETAFAIEPEDAAVLRQFQLWDQILVSPTEEERTALAMELLDITADQFYLFGISTNPPGYGIVVNDVCNVPDSMISSWPFLTPGPSNPFLYYRASNGECP